MSKFYVVIPKEININFAYTSQATIDCMCCGKVMEGCGGGGYYLCKECVDEMLNGNISSAIYLFNKAKSHGNFN